MRLPSLEEAPTAWGLLAVPVLVLLPIALAWLAQGLAAVAGVDWGMVAPNIPLADDCPE